MKICFRLIVEQGRLDSRDLVDGGFLVFTQSLRNTGRLLKRSGQGPSRYPNEPSETFNSPRE